MKYNRSIFIVALLLVLLPNTYGQRVGVVLSGGGTNGAAHVGLLKALEEAEIPIDYITGTSAGALVGAMYASGYSPEEIEHYILSDAFEIMSSGGLPSDKAFFLRKSSDDASLLNVPFSIDSLLKKSLPTNFITPSYLDYEMLRVLGLTSLQVDEDFNKLFVPFRCVASDITEKKSVIFGEGKLNEAVRASMTYPFYMNPIRVDGKLLFDGGLYNNFPADVMYNEFSPDFIIGSNVSYNAAPPEEDDLISQITNMLVTPTNFSLPCENGIIISPQNDVGTFDFSRSSAAIDSGYLTAKKYLDSIRLYVHRRKNRDSLRLQRQEFMKKIQPVSFKTVTATSNSGEHVKFVERSVMRDSTLTAIDWETFTKRYFRAYSSPQVSYIYPTMEREKDSTVSLSLNVTKQKTFVLSVGGHFSSRPVNTGYIGFSYLGLDDAALRFHASSYFGKFYGSTKVKADYDVPTKTPLRFTPYFTLSRWDYFRSFSTFFEDVRPSFLVQKELYYGTKISAPVGNSFKLDFDFRAFEVEDQYYQSKNFTNADTTDLTLFDGQTIALGFERNSLNRKQWASAGSYLRFHFRFVQGREQSVSGSTAPIAYDVRKRHHWINLNIEGQYFPISKGVFRLGLHGKGVVNSQSLFANYTASLLTMTAFEPLPDSRTFFMEEYRAPQYVGAGLNFIASINDLFDLRFDPYFFQPFRKLTRNDDGTFGYSDLFEEGTLMAGASLIYHSPVGPLRFSGNYFPKQSKPFVFQLSFGYVLFNDRAIR